MGKESYRIPQGPTKQYEFQRNAIALSTSNATAWNVPADLLSKIAPLQAAYVQCYNVANNRNTQSPAATVDRNQAWIDLALLVVELYDQHLINNSLISAAEKMSLSIKTSSGRGTISTPPAVTVPVVVLASKEASMLHVVFTDSGSINGGHAKPKGVAFCEVWAKIDGPAPVSPDECTERYNIARSNQVILFDTTQRAKTIYGFARWVNKNGKVGIWGSVFSSIIP